MATLVLQTAGTAVGAALGGPLGGALGGLTGNMIDHALIGSHRRRVDGPRLDDLHVQASSEGMPIPRLFGRARLAGQLIWATHFEERLSTHTEGAGGKATGGSMVEVRDYRYYGNFAVGLCQGPVTRIGRVWADGEDIDISQYTWRFYRGDDDQLADSLIEAKEGPGRAPAYRGLAYVVFEALPLERFGNRVPQFTLEVFKAMDDMESTIRGVNIIPGSTEFGYDVEPVKRDLGQGKTGVENTHTAALHTDWSVSLDALQASCRNVEAAALVVAWFGDDLRSSLCKIRPGVENRDKKTTPEPWAVAGISRAEAYKVSEIDDRPAFGGTPCDRSVIRAIKDMKARRLKIVFYPFILMDIPPDNTLADPAGGAPGQPAYPWRGRITCDRAPGTADTPDKTAAVTAQIEAFFGQVGSGDFSISDGGVACRSAGEWSFRRMILHYAHLCALAGGVDAFLIGSELVGLTTLRDDKGHYPAVDGLMRLASEVGAIVPDAKISYAADWSEYFGHHTADGSHDVFFHLDPLWMHDAIDFIGIDNYMPLADWRDGPNHLDRQAGARSIYDLDYLKGNIAGAEGFDWHYESDENRERQIRSPITDGAYGKPWVFRYKDLVGWWSNEHYDRPGGIENARPTLWRPRAKPIWFTETGCPAVDKGANQPNVFNDARSSQSSLPHFSSGNRDDFMQRCCLRAFHEYWTQQLGQAGNPISTVYDGPMVDPGRIFVWAFDARPFPVFPYRGDVWSDGPNYETGHWLNGRMGAVPLAALVSALVAGSGDIACDVSELEGVIDGYLIDRPMSARDALEPLALAFAFDAVETGRVIRFRPCRAQSALVLRPGDLADCHGDDPLFQLTRAQESELPASVTLGYVDGLSDYRKTAVTAHRLVGHSIRQASADLSAVMSQSLAQSRAEIWLYDLWAGRERAQFALPPSACAVEPGDVVTLTVAGRSRLLRIVSINDADVRRVEAVSLDPSVYDGVGGPQRSAYPNIAPVYGKPILEFLDLPLLTGKESPQAGYFAGYAKPWPGALAILRSANGLGFSTNCLLTSPAIMGVTLNALPPGPTSRWTRGARLEVEVFSGALSSVEPLPLFAGANVAGLRSPEGVWEVMQFRLAELIGPNLYRLSGLLRGQSGTEVAMSATLPPGARFVLINGAVVQSDMTLDEIGLALTYRCGPVGRDPGDAAFVQASHVFRGVGLRPLSPVHIRGERDPASADIMLRWIRRTRIGGDSWEQTEVPLGEDSEAYEVDILGRDDTVIRTLRTSEPKIIYTATDQKTDFVTIPSALDVAVYQLSATRGRGSARRARIHV
ncbi:MAG: glycoside hydrolase/phage tail family protein [Hyphomicrobiales bacterium]